jgi:predicted dehydrogenase
LLIVVLMQEPSTGKKPRVGVIGVGHLGRAHVRVLSGLDSCELVGCNDIVREKSEKAAEDFDSVAFPSAQELIERCDAVSVVVPTSEHHRCAMDVLRSRKHLFLEKPIATTTEQAHEIVSLADSLGVKLMIGHIERFNPALEALRQSITYPTFIEAHRLARFNPRGLDVAVIYDLMIHDIDLCLHMVRSDVVDIQASAAAVVTEKMDIANARLGFANGCTANLTASRISPNAMRKLRLFQPHGYISFDLKEQSAEVYRLIGKNETIPDGSGYSMAMAFGNTDKKIVYRKPDIRKYDMLTAELESFIQSINAGESVAATGYDGLAALRVASEIERIAQMSLDEINTRLDLE